MQVCMHTCTHTWMHTHTHTHTCAHAHMCTHTHTCIYVCMHVHTHTCTCTHTHTCACTHAHTHAPTHTSVLMIQSLIYTQLKMGSKQRLETDEDRSMEQKTWHVSCSNNNNNMNICQAPHLDMSPKHFIVIASTGR